LSAISPHSGPSGDVDLFSGEEKLELSVDWRAHDPVQLAVAA
jgi:hypothetical protein